MVEAGFLVVTIDTRGMAGRLDAVQDSLAFDHLGPLKTVIRAFLGPAGPKNGFFGRILLRYGQTVGCTENTWTPTESFRKADKSSSL